MDYALYIYNLGLDTINIFLRRDVERLELFFVHLSHHEGAIL